MIVPVSRNVNIICLRRKGPVTRNPDIPSVVPPPITIDPFVAGVRRFTAVIIHWLTGRILC